MANVDSRQKITTWLTLVIVGLWIISFVVRFWTPIPVASVLDSAMPLVIGYWFVSGAATGKNGKAATV